MNERNERNEREEPIVIRRVLVAVDASPSSYAALEAAVHLAERFEAELLGLFVEDVNVLRLAQLPFVREVGVYSARRRRPDTEEIERQLRARSRRLQRALRSLAERASVQASFRVTRGAVSEEIEAAAEEVDILVIGRYGWSRIRRRLGSTARAAYYCGAPSATLLLEEDARIEPPIRAVYDGSEQGRSGLAIAAELVEETSGPLRVLLLADGRENAPRLRREATALLSPYHVIRQYQVLTESTVPKLVRAIRRSDGGTLILPARISALRDDAVLELIEEIDIPVLMIR
ncbi:MAG: universal stress protein [Anaerolineae bacterium]